MSFYAQLQGSIKYKTEEALNDVLEILINGGWMNEDYIWLEETGTEKYDAPEPTVIFENNILNIPQAHYRNLSRKENKIVSNAEIATIVGSSADGQFRGWITTEQENWSINLQTWARTRGHDTVQPHEIQEVYTNWQTDIMDEWHEVHGKYPRFN